jgi:hypothetical protein
MKWKVIKNRILIPVDTPSPCHLTGGIFISLESQMP